jgi:hypothetical protein
VIQRSPNSSLFVKSRTPNIIAFGQALGGVAVIVVRGLVAADVNPQIFPFLVRVRPSREGRNHEAIQVYSRVEH